MGVRAFANLIYVHIKLPFGGACSQIKKEKKKKRLSLCTVHESVHGDVKECAVNDDKEVREEKSTMAEKEKP